MGVSNKRKEEIAKYLSKENLEKYLSIYSANYIATKLFPGFKTTAGTVIDTAKKLGIETHTSSSSCLLKSTKQAKRKTLINKYGVDNPSKAQVVKDIKEQKALEKYGVKNVFQSDVIKKKLKATCLEKYGAENVGILQLGKRVGKRSKFHRKIEDILISLGLEFDSEKTCLCKKYNTVLKKNYSPIVDIVLNEHKVVIECNGDFWHANPKTYKETDVFHTFSGAKTAKEIWESDKIRVEHIESFGYTVLIIWESDYYSDIEKVKKDILDVVKNQTD